MCLANFRKALGLLFIASVSAIHCSGQGTNGKIAGVVRDTSGGVIISATVTCTNVATREQQTVQTDSQGNFSLLALRPGEYDLEARSQGFKNYKQTGIKIDVQAALQINIVLSPGTQTETVQVNAEAVQVEITNTQLGNVIGGKSMESMPLNGRSFTNLMSLQPGVAPVTSTLEEGLGPSASASAATGNVSINGQTEAANGFLVNGANIEQTRNNAAALLPNLDSIAEFRVITNNNDAEYGHYSGGVVSVVTKSGSNQFHGDIFDFLRNTTLDSRNFFDTARGVFRRNQYGGTLGGPIKRNKAFFFIDYQGTRELQEITQGEVSVPTVAQRSGDFSTGSPFAGTLNSSGTSIFPSVLEGRTNCRNDIVTKGGPAAGAALDAAAAGTPEPYSSIFVNNQIPPSCFSPAAVGLLPQIVSPNVGGQFFVGSGKSANNFDTNNNQGAARVDYNSRRWGTISAYYSIADTRLLRPYGGDNIPGSPVLDTSRPQFWNLSDTKLFGTSAVNELRVSVLRYVSYVNKPLNFGPPLGQLGFVTSRSLGGITPADSHEPGSPNLHFNNFSVGIPDFSYKQFETSPQFLDNFSKVIGAHTLKFGGEFNSTYFHQFFPQSSVNGTFFFSGAETGSDFADFLIGAPDVLGQSSDVNYHNWKKYFGVYGEDSWKVNSSLTVNIGLRWDYIQNWYEKLNSNAQTFIPGEQSVIWPTAPAGIVFPGDPSPLGGKIPRTVQRTPLKNFAPRIGVAWSPSANSGILGWLVGSSGKTSIRAAYGIFYNNNEGHQAYNTTGSPPYAAVWGSAIPPLLEAPYRERATGIVDNAPPFPDYIPPPPGASVYKGCPTCAVGPINWELPMNGVPAWTIRNTTPYTEDYHLTMERTIGAATVLSIGYVGSQSHHLLSAETNNPGNPQLCLSLSQPSQVAPGTPTCGPFGENTVYTRADGTIVNGTRAPLGINFATNTFYDTNGNAHYHSLQVSVQHSTERLSMLAGYTFSKSIDDETWDVGNYNIYNRQLSRGLSSFDIAHSFVVSYGYLLPIDRLSGNRWQRLTGGWRLMGITRFATGLPVNLTVLGDQSLTGMTFGHWEVPVYTGAPLNFQDPRSRKPYFNINAFQVAPPGVLNTAGHSFFHGPGINNWDMSLIKETKISERFSVEFRAEFFNVFNHTQFENPTSESAGQFQDVTSFGNISSSIFGVITQARDPRIGQLALKVLF